MEIYMVRVVQARLASPPRISNFPPFPEDGQICLKLRHHQPNTRKLDSRHMVGFNHCPLVLCHLQGQRGTSPRAQRVSSCRHGLTRAWPRLIVMQGFSGTRVNSKPSPGHPALSPFCSPGMAQALWRVCVAGFGGRPGQVFGGEEGNHVEASCGAPLCFRSIGQVCNSS